MTHEGAIKVLREDVASLREDIHEATRQLGEVGVRMQELSNKNKGRRWPDSDATEFWRLQRREVELSEGVVIMSQSLFRAEELLKEEGKVAPAENRNG